MFLGLAAVHVCVSVSARDCISVTKCPNVSPHFSRLVAFTLPSEALLFHWCGYDHTATFGGQKDTAGAGMACELLSNK